MSSRPFARGESSFADDVTWVSKTDIARFFRCPYAFWKVDRGDLRSVDAMDEPTRQRIGRGHAFHRTVEASIPTSDLGDLLPPRGLSNTSRRLYGVPDALRHLDGKLFPVEFKSHSSVARLDRIELAFYWHVLEEHQDPTGIEPQGYLILSTHTGEPSELLEVRLTPAVLREALRLTEEVRRARREGAVPRICRCSACGPGGPLHDEVVEEVSRRRGLSLINGLGRTDAERLERVGIDTVDELAEQDLLDLLGCFWSQGLDEPRMLDRFIVKARSYRDGKPVLHGRLPKLDGTIALLDLEYEPGQFVWLTGLRVSESLDSQQANYHVWWADTPRDEAANLRRLIEVLGREHLHLVTWGGKGADMPELQKALSRHGMEDHYSDLARRHVDLYQAVSGAVALPLPHLRLKEVAEFFGYSRSSSLIDGQRALLEFEAYRRVDDMDEKQRLKDRLLAYHREDLDSLLHTARALVAL